MTLGVDRLRIREAVRAVVADEDDRVLLVRFDFPTATVWALPGGGVEPGEHDEVALGRELTEEVGQGAWQIGAHLWTRTHVFPFIDGSYDGQRERAYLVRCASFLPCGSLTAEQLRDEYVHDVRWWTLDDLDLAAADGATFAPQRLPSLVREILQSGVPQRPLILDQ